MAKDTLKRLSGLLVCPSCGSGLTFSDTAATCDSCSNYYPIRNGKIFFLDSPPREDQLDDAKGRLKRLLGKAYYTVGIQVFAPTFPFSFSRAVTTRINPSEAIVLEVGCGTHKVHPDAIGVDLYAYSAVDVVCDIAHPPFKANSVDAVVSRSVLEHVPRVWEVLENLKTCTKRNGLHMHAVPFMFPFHSSPYDFYRFTHEGLITLYPGWKMREQWNTSGPVSLFLSAFIEFISILLSFGSSRLRPLIYLLLCGLLFPIKFLDVVFVRRHSFLNLAPSVFSVLEKVAD